MHRAEKPVEAVIFDLDGTLIDSAADIHAALNRHLAAHALPALGLPLVTSFIGKGAPHLLRRAYDHLRQDVAEAVFADRLGEFLKHYAAQGSALTTCYPGARATLDELCQAGIKIGLCTNKPFAVTDIVLTQLGLDEVFDVVVGGDSLSTRKPDPEPIRYVLQQLGVTPDQALYIGDSDTDLRAARAAGVPVWLVQHGYHTEPLSAAPDRHIERLSAILHIAKARVSEHERTDMAEVRPRYAAKRC